MNEKNEDVKTALDLINEIPVPDTPMNVERTLVASAVGDNSEFNIYIANRLDTIRTEALIESSNSLDVEELGASVLEKRGAILELSRMHTFFKSCSNGARKEDDD